MSVFKDDMGLGDALQKIQTNNFRIKTEKETKVSDKSSSEIVVKSDEVELSTDAVVRKKNSNKALEEAQNEKSFIDKAKQSLSTIDGNLANLESKIEETLKNPDKTSLEELEKSAKEDIKKIKDETENASFNGAKIFDKNNEISQNKQNNDIISNNSIQDESKLKELGKLEEPAFQDKQQVQDFLKLAQEARQEVESKQIGLAAIDEKLVNRVSSLIEFESNIKPPEMKIQEHGNELAQAAKDSILANPKQATQVQLNVLDEKIILAMFSITRRN